MRRWPRLITDGAAAMTCHHSKMQFLLSRNTELLSFSSDLSILVCPQAASVQGMGFDHGMKPVVEVNWTQLNMEPQWCREAHSSFTSELQKETDQLNLQQQGKHRKKVHRYCIATSCPNLSSCHVTFTAIPFKGMDISEISGQMAELLILWR